MTTGRINQVSALFCDIFETLRRQKVPRRNSKTTAKKDLHTFLQGRFNERATLLNTGPRQLESHQS